MENLFIYIVHIISSATTLRTFINFEMHHYANISTKTHNWQINELLLYISLQQGIKWSTRQFKRWHDEHKK